jgi:hypothetical protein
MAAIGWNLLSLTAIALPTTTGITAAAKVRGLLARIHALLLVKILEADVIIKNS